MAVSVLRGGSFNSLVADSVLRGGPLNSLVADSTAYSYRASTAQHTDVETALMFCKCWI